MPLIPGSGATSYDTQEMHGAKYEFVGGVSMPSFVAIKSGISALLTPLGAAPTAAAPKIPEQQTHDTVYTYDDGERRVITELPNGSKTVRRELKEAKMTMNFELPAAPYDLRVMVSLEDSRPITEAAAATNGTGVHGESSSSAANAMVLPGWRTTRRRRRISWESPAQTPPDQVSQHIC